MKKILTLILLCSFFFISCGKKEKNTLEKIIEKDMLSAAVRVDAEPLGYIDEFGRNAGFDIDIARYIAEKITGSRDKVIFIPVSASGRIEAVTSGRADIVIAAMSETESRRAFIDFSIPYYTAGQTAAVRKNSKIHTFSDLKDKTIIVLSGSTAKQNMLRVMPEVRFLEYKSYDEAFNALTSGKGDAVCADDTIISGFIAHNKDNRALKNRISSEYYSIGMQKTEDKTLKNKIDAVIEEMNAEGILKQLKQKHNLL